MTQQPGELSPVERIKASSDGLRGTLPAEIADSSTHVSEPGRHLLKFHGAYEQDDRDARRARKDAGEEPAYSFMVRATLPAVYGAVGGLVRWPEVKPVILPSREGR